MITISLAFGKEKIIFHQKVINVADENRLRQRLFGLAEKEREEKAFELNVSALIEYEAEKAELITVENGEEIKTPINLKDYFGEKTVNKERIVEYAMRAYFAALTPTVDFL